MATSNHPEVVLLGNLQADINRQSFVSLEERDNLIHTFLNDCSFYLNSILNIKTAVRTYDDEFFNLQLFNELENYELLVTYFPLDSNKEYQINNCNSNELQFEYEIYYKIEAKENNKTRIKEASSYVNLLMCKNYNNSKKWEYIDLEFGKKYLTDPNNNSNNKLLSEQPLFSISAETNFLFFRQKYSFKFSYQNI